MIKRLREKLAKTAKKEVKEKYSWPVVAEQLENVYLERIQKPTDHSWDKIYDMENTVEDADLKCQFRQEPHLL